METSEPEFGEDKTLVHYQKINIIGESGVGKSTLISLFTDYDKIGEKIEIKIKRKESLSSQNSDYNDSLIEKVSKAEIEINENNKLYYNLYETNLDDMDSIQSYLGVLLMQTECVIFMWNKQNLNSFKKIPRLISLINEDIKNNNLRDFPIILLQNDVEKDVRESQNSKSDIDIDEFINKAKNEFKNIYHKILDISNKDNLKYFFLDLNKTINDYEKMKNQYIRNNDIVHLVKFNPKQGNNNNEIKFKCKCLLLGFSSVGKTTFFNYLTGKEFNNNISTLGVGNTNILAKVNDDKILIELFDTAGQERYDSLGENILREVEGVLLFYDITNEKSFDKVYDWIKKINEKNGKNVEIVLIGNKIDLSETRKVNKAIAIDFAKTKNIKYFECSSLNGLNVYEILNEFIFGVYKIKSQKNDNEEENQDQKILRNNDNKIIKQKNLEIPEKSKCIC